MVSILVTQSRLTNRENTQATFASPSRTTVEKQDKTEKRKGICEALYVST